LEKGGRKQMKKRCKCRICGKEGEFETYQVKEMMKGTLEKFLYFWCDCCECLQIETIPANLGDYYGGNYYSFQSPTIQKTTPNKDYQDQFILDVGCGAGYWLCEMANQGYSHLYGCDPFLEQEIEYENGVKIKKCTIHEMEGKFDKIQLSHSFEHMADPQDVMNSIYRLLKDGGVCEIAIPVVPNIAFELYQQYWYQLDAPRHLFLHSKRSIAFLARMASLRIQKVEFVSNNGQFLHSILYRKGILFWEHNNCFNRYFKPKDFVRYEKMSQKANEEEYGDQARFYLKKEFRQGQTI